MLKRIVSLVLLLGWMTFAAGAEFKHQTATVKVKGDWQVDPESNNTLLILNSSPEGHQIVVSVLNLNRTAANLDQVAQAAAKVFELRMTAAQKLSSDVKFDKPEVTTTKTTVVCVCRGFAPISKVRMVFRIDGSAGAVRSVSVYDYTNQPEDKFQKWSNDILAGIK